MYFFLKLVGRQWVHGVSSLFNIMGGFSTLAFMPIMVVSLGAQHHLGYRPFHLMEIATETVQHPFQVTFNQGHHWEFQLMGPKPLREVKNTQF